MKYELGVKSPRKRFKGMTRWATKPKRIKGRFMAYVAMQEADQRHQMKMDLETWKRWRSGQEPKKEVPPDVTVNNTPDIPFIG